MQKNKRKIYIDSLLNRCSEQLTAIQKQYQDSLKNQNISPELRIDIKNYFENLKSTLDYLSLDIRDDYFGTAKKNNPCYFPLFDTEKEFLIGCDKIFPGIKNSHDNLLVMLRNCQPYQGEYNWIRDFNKINNTNKHGELVEQTKTEFQRTHVTGNSGQVSWSHGVTFSAGVSILGVPIDPKTQQPIENKSVVTEKIIWVDFHFNGFETSAISLINYALPGIRKIHQMFYEQGNKHDRGNFSDTHHLYS